VGIFDLDYPGPKRQTTIEYARKVVYRAIRTGRLVRGPCERRRRKDGCHGRIEGHHDDYERPLEVRWLCSKHHRQVDIETGKRTDEGASYSDSRGRAR